MKGKLFFIIVLSLIFAGVLARNASANSLAPIAVASANPQVVALGTTVNFDGSGSYDPDFIDITAYSWMLGLGADGKTGETAISASCHYDTLGIKAITLDVTDNDSANGYPPNKNSISGTCYVTVFDLRITSVNPKTFTTDNSDNDINCIAEIQPSSLSSYNNNIEWNIEDNPNDSNNCGDPTDPSNGNNVTWSATIPPIPSNSNGRGFPLSYRIRAQITIGDETVTSDTYITQDEIDQCRQEYIDMNKSDIPARNEFVNNSTYSNPGHFAFNEINSGDFNIAIFTIAQHLENIRSAIGDQSMPVNSGYRNPIHNASIGGATESRHIYGDAADIGRQDWDGDEDQDYDDWDLMRDAAINEGSTYVEPYAQTGTWVHMDWR